MNRPNRWKRGPVLTEVLAGLQRVAAEARLTAQRVRVHCQLRALERDERRAIRELAWLHREYLNAQANFALIERRCKNQRRALQRRLQETLRDRSGDCDAAS
ncbi:hypothetical protein PIN31009_04983 [Pandoraea iniqua]|uniref:hypothetical protein n=1 Tax=Pandoraea iniqua TaxID=2508288 RepID=UPI001242BB4E|nr:hypothetical protein [Pandoraea iniqua]VVE55623.1 hypothetical protein PIN31009_04983 [Pandoraea iniqua]